VGRAGEQGKLWTVEEMVGIRREIEDAGLVLEAIENLDPAVWHDVLLDGPKRAAQIEDVKTIIRGWVRLGFRCWDTTSALPGCAGGFQAVGPRRRGYRSMDGPVDDVPIPAGSVWNMVYDPDAAEGFVLP